MIEHPQHRAHILRTAEAFGQRLNIETRTAPYKGLTYRDPACPYPSFVLDDVSEIPFLDGISAVEFYQLRARLRADTGDLFAATCPEIEGYEAYNRTYLGIGSPGFVYAAPGNLPPIALSEACEQPETLETISLFARKAGGLTLQPYMGNTQVWALAATIKAHANVDVNVLAPTPPVTWLSNDKVHLTHFANDMLQPLLGRDVCVPSIASTNASELAVHLLSLSQHHARVALKMPRCASAMGNALFEARDVQELAANDQLLDAVQATLRDKEWNGEEPVLAVAWLNAQSSPSTQLWVPPLGHGEPRLDGVYEQLLVGPEQVFEGALPSRLGPSLDTQLGDISLALTLGFQALGYVGRCSFDFIVSEGIPYLVECNGRWGGTSIPMHLMDRLFPDGRPTYRARDVIAPQFAGRPFSDLLEALRADLYDTRSRTGHLIVYNVGCLQSHGKFDAIALGENIEDATKHLEVGLVSRLGMATS